jgi:GntR family transcriptional regulator/MocR family aminotransferase
MPSARNLPIAIDPSDEMPLFLQIVRALSEDVLRGRLRPGQSLPGSRTLAEDVGVHRSTVVAAYGELVAQGWAVTRPRGGTAIAATSPQVEPRRFAVHLPPRTGSPASAGFAVAPWPAKVFRPGRSTPRRPGVLVLGGSVPDIRLVPRAATRACARWWRGWSRRRGAWRRGRTTS